MKSAIVRKMIKTPAVKQPVMIMLTGDMVEEDFMGVLKEAMMEYTGEVPPIFADDAVVVAAKAAAELRRRGQAAWQ